MQGDKQVIKHLNKQLKNELTASNQYFLHARMYENWGFQRMFAHEYKEAMEEMRHADEIIQRILLLEGLPNVQELHKMLIGEDLIECMSADLALEKNAHKDLVDGITYFEKVKDYVSRDMFTKILDETEEHIDYLETQLELVNKVGRENYLQTQIGGDQGDA